MARLGWGCGGFEHLLDFKSWRAGLEIWWLGLEIELDLVGMGWIFVLVRDLDG